MVEIVGNSRIPKKEKAKKVIVPTVYGDPNITNHRGSKDDHRNDLNEHHHSPRHIGRMGELVLHALAIYIYIHIVIYT